MNSVIVQSRFACLQVEDEEPKQGANRKKPNNKTVNGNKKTQASIKKTAQPKQQPTREQPIVSKKKKSKPMSEQQWEEWKKKDSELVNDNFQQDMQKAILQSKLDYEACKTTSNQQIDTKKENNNKKKKNKTMSLDQFLNNPENKDEEESKDAEISVTRDKNFFEKIIQDAKQELNKEEALERQKKRNENIEEVISIAQYQERLEKEKAKNTALQDELKSLKKEMDLVKARNKSLCAMLSHGEMKDKADVLSELDRLNAVRDELTQEVSRLHGLLEQERSKTASLTTDPKHRTDKKSKKH